MPSYPARVRTEWEHVSVGEYAQIEKNERKGTATEQLTENRDQTIAFQGGALRESEEKTRVRVARKELRV